MPLETNKPIQINERYIVLYSYLFRCFYYTKLFIYVETANIANMNENRIECKQNFVSRVTRMLLFQRSKVILLQTAQF